MIATVSAVKFNQPLGSYKVTKLCVVNDKGEDKEYNIFTNAKFHGVVENLKAGDNIEIKLEKNGKYWNVADVIKKDSGQVSSSGGQRSGTGDRQQEQGNKDLAIARAVALKAGVELYGNLIQAGLVKKTLKPEAAVEEVFAITKRFEGYCTLADDLSDLTSDSSSLARPGAGTEYEETDFPE